MKRVMITAILAMILAFGVTMAGWATEPPIMEKPLLMAPLATPTQAAEGATLILFCNRTCPYCHQMTQVVGELQAKYGSQISVIKYDSQTDDYIFKKYRVSLVPTLVILSPSGSEVYRHEGGVSRETLISTLKSMNFIRDCYVQ